MVTMEPYTKPEALLGRSHVGLQRSATRDTSPAPPSSRYQGQGPGELCSRGTPSQWRERQ